MEVIDTLREDLNKTIKDCALNDISFVRLTKYDSVLRQFAKRHLRNGELTLKNSWLWEEMKEPYTVEKEFDLESLVKSMGADLIVWFIATEENGKYWVLSGPLGSFEKLVNESYHFEYYVVGPDYTWMFVENHHGAIFSRGLPHRANIE